MPVSLQPVSVASKNEQRSSFDCRIATRSSPAALNRTLPNVQWREDAAGEPRLRPVDVVERAVLVADTGDLLERPVGAREGLVLDEGPHAQW